MNQISVRHACIFLALCLSVSSSVLAFSGRELAIHQAFSYAYNNPQPQMGQGPMGSSMYSGTSFAMPTYGTSPLSDAYRITGPIAPMTITASGDSATMTASPENLPANPVREFASVLAQQQNEPPSVTGPRLTSLAPDSPGSVRLPMMQGETLFRQGQYAQAAASFETARIASGSSPESLLSLAQTYFAMGNAYYGRAADSLAQALQRFPDLPLVRVRPQDFFGTAEEYAKAFASLEQYVKENPGNSGVLFLLAYMQWRQGLVDKALTSLKAAAAASPGKELADAIVTLQDGIARSGQVILSEAPALEEAKDYSWAGIRLAVPSGFAGDPLTSPNQVLSGMVTGQDPNDVKLVSLAAYTTGSTVSVKAFTDSIMNSMRQAPFVRDMKIDAEAEVPFQTGKALVRLFTYTSASNEGKAATAWLAFIREPQGSQGRPLAYLLGVAGTEAQTDKLLPMLAAMAKTISLADPKGLPLSSMDIGGSRFTDRQFLFSITQPQGWAGRQTDKGFDMGQMDFAQGNVVSPKAEVIVQTIPASYTPKSFGEEALQRKTPKGFVWKLLSEEPAKLAGQNGYRFIVNQTPQEGAAGASSVLAAYVTCVDRPEGGKTMYALVLRCQDAQPPDVEQLAEKLAASFEIIPSEQAPSESK